MSTFKELIATNLLAICQEATNNTKHKLEEKAKVKLKYNKFVVDDVRKLTTIITDGRVEKTNAFLKILAILLEAPELNPKEGDQSTILDPFSVVILTNNNTSKHVFQQQVPFIVTNGKVRQILNNDGATDIGYFAPGEFRLASSEEVLTCIQNLTDAQWRSIRREDLFSSVIEAAENMELGESQQQQTEGED